MVNAVGMDSGQTASIGSGTRYSIQRGDTLSEIAAANGVTVAAMMRANPQITNPDLIYAGATLVIPAGGRSNGGGSAAVGGAAGVDGAAGGGSGRNAADVARQYMGRNASDLRSDRSDNLPMDAGVPTNVCCANFVSAVLTEAGQLPQSAHTNSVEGLRTTLEGRGWTRVSAAEARPGDVVIIQGGGVSHTVIYAGNGRTIGSNNRNQDGSQRVTDGSLSWAMSKGAIILRAPAGTGGSQAAGGGQAAGGAQAAGGGQAAGGVGPAAATREARQQQAINFFVSQGWTRAQAVGIVANLDAESRMESGIRQIGGGPGFGLAQWEGPRQADFARWAGHDIRSSTFEEQLRFVQHELTTTERGAGNRLRNATSAADAAAIVCRYYERPADTAGQSAYRARLATEIAGR